MPLIRRLVRIPVLLLHVALGIVVIGLAIGVDRLTGSDPTRGVARSAQSFWCRSICTILGIRLQVVGQPLLPPPVLVVANHISWLDILVVSAHWQVCFLSKAEIRRWPGIGWLATCLDTIYIDRGIRGASNQALEGMQQRLRQRKRVLFFPEGTTSIGHQVLPFRSRLFQAAIEEGMPVQPLTIHYVDHGGHANDSAAFVGEDTLLRHTFRLAGCTGITAIIAVGEPVDSAECSRKELALRTREQMAAVLDPVRPETVVIKR